MSNAMAKQRYHVFVGIDMEGDPCLYVAKVDKQGNTTGKYASDQTMQQLAGQLQQWLDEAA